jgi:dipeptidyl aminopeptidase/acylaminoacyl peptidase
MGFSYGGFLTQFALTHSRVFATASVSDGGSWNPISYWVNAGDTYRSDYDQMFGGPPEGKSFDAWKAFAPSFNAHRIAAPVLFETHTTLPTIAVTHQDFITHASCAGVAIEGVVYFNAPHVLAAPAQRLSSMERNLDWFTFWLLTKEDSDPAKREQYQRWRRLREVQERRTERRDPKLTVCQQ